MTRTQFSIAVEIPAPQPLVWSVLAYVDRRPEWTASISRVKMLSPGPLRVGSRVRVHQRKLPPAFWRVTELNPGASFTWVSRAPEVRVTARHSVEAIAAGGRVTVLKHGGVLVGPGQMRQVFNETESEALWLIVGTPENLEYPLNARVKASGAFKMLLQGCNHGVNCPITDHELIHDAH